jgi:hypothetical protein
MAVSVIQAGFGAAGLGKTLTGISVGAFNLPCLASMIVYVGMIGRLPMVAGWDHTRSQCPWGVALPARIAREAQSR